MLAALSGLGALPFTAGLARAAQRSTPAAAGAIILSTWDFGAAANAAAFARMRAGGSLIDAVEAGGMVPEADPNNHSVGYSGYPDRDGHVTLDAVIMDDAGGVGAVAASASTLACAGSAAPSCAMAGTAQNSSDPARAIRDTVWSKII